MKTEREILNQIEKIENNIKISENKVKYWQSRKDSFMIDLENVMKLFPMTSKWLNMLAEEERIHNEFMKKAQEIIGNSL